MCRSLIVTMRFYDNADQTPPHLVEDSEFVNIDPSATLTVEGTHFGEREVLDRVQSATASIDYCIWP